jgi:hypothetical protein
VLDDDAGRALAEFGGQLERGVGVVQVVEAQFLALKLAGGSDTRP